MDWQATQNQEYLMLLSRRLSEPPLLWVNQFVAIINNWINQTDLDSTVSINDLGCNVGHFYRGIRNIKKPVDYCGFDISETYLKIARDNFSNTQFLNFDIAGSIMPRLADVNIISATLEHIENHELAIKNIFDSSKYLTIIRTFIGDNHFCDRCLTDGASDEYLIKQFMLEDLAKYPKKNGWDMLVVKDVATKSKPKFVCNGRTILRTQKIIIFTRNEK